MEEMSKDLLCIEFKASHIFRDGNHYADKLTNLGLVNKDVKVHNDVKHEVFVKNNQYMMP